jgi:hypothetical protein
MNLDRILRTPPQGVHRDNGGARAMTTTRDRFETDGMTSGYYEVITSQNGAPQR